MQYRLIALDLDYTLLATDRTISERNKRAIQRAVEKGATVVLATGRPFGGTKQFCAQLEMTQPVITNGGAVVCDGGTGEVLFDINLDQELARTLIAHLHERNCYHQIYDRSPDFMTESYNMYTELYVYVTGMHWRTVGDFLKLPVIDTPKILAVDMASRLRGIAEGIRERWGDLVNVGLSRPYFMEIYDRRAHKGAALQRLTERMGLSAENVIAIGDSEIDRSMIEYAGLGVAMKNSTPDVLAAADLVAPGNDEDGVAWVIEKYVLGEEQSS